MNELIEEFLMLYDVVPSAIPDVLLKSGITEQSNLFDVLVYLDTLKETHPHYFERKIHYKNWDGEDNIIILKERSNV